MYKCTVAGINSRNTVPSKVCGTQVGLILDKKCQKKIVTLAGGCALEASTLHTFKTFKLQA
jgi:hypothetical protein